MESRPQRKRKATSRFEDFVTTSSPKKNKTTSTAGAEIPPKRCPGFQGSRCDNGGWVRGRYNGYTKGKNGRKRKYRYDKLCPKHLQEQLRATKRTRGPASTQTSQVHLVLERPTGYSLKTHSGATQPSSSGPNQRSENRSNRCYMS